MTIEERAWAHGAAGDSPASSPPLPEITPMNRFYWDSIAAGRLSLLRCQACAHFVHFPRPICDRCLSTDLQPEEISGIGVLYSYSVIMQAGHPYFIDKIPYVIGLVEIDEEAGVRLATNIVGCPEGELRCGMPVAVEFSLVTSTLTLPLFRPTGVSAPADLVRPR